MTIRSFAIVSLAVVTASLVATAQQVRVKSVAISALPKSATTTTLHLKNLRDSPLIAWEIGPPTSADATDRIVTAAREDHFGIPVATGPHGPMQPGESREMQIVRGHGPAPVSAAVTMAIFEDGYSEGTASSLMNALTSWRERADDLAWWIRVFNEMPRSSDAEARQYLAAKIVERAPLPDSIGVRGNLAAFLRGDPPPTALIGIVDRRFREGAEAQLAMAGRFLARGVPSESGAVRSVEVRVSAAPDNEYDLRIENLTGKVIEAWGFEVRTGKQTRRESADGCADAPTSVSPRGRLMPYVVRLEPLPSTFTEQQAPVASMSYVVFEDLSAEGPQAEIARVFRDRERQAQEFAYWIPVLTQTLTMSAGEAKSFLAAKEAERARQAAAANRLFSSPETRDLRELLDRSPERFAAAATARIQSMQEARARLLRHVKAK